VNGVVAGTAGATGSDGWGACLGPAVVCGAAVAVPMAYLPNLDTPFTAPKLTLLLLAAAMCFAGEVLSALGRADESEAARYARWPPRLVLALAALVGTTVLSAVAARSPRGPGAPYATTEIVRLVAVVGIALGAARAVRVPSWRRAVLRSIHAAGGAVSVIGLLQHLQVLPLPLPIISLPGATFGNRNMAAEAVAVSLPFGLAWLALEGGRGTRRPHAGGEPAPVLIAPTTTVAAGVPVLIVVVLILETLYVAVTRTRGAWLGAAIGAATWFALRRPGVSRAALGVTLAVTLVATVAALVPGRSTERDVLDVKRHEPGQRLLLDAVDPRMPAARTRLGLWRRTLALAGRHPLVGVGPGNFAVLFPLVAEPGARADGVLSPSEVPRRAHNDLLERLCDCGLLGLGALLAVYGVALAIVVQHARRDRAVTARGSPGPTATAAGTHGDVIVAAAGAASLAALIACGITGFPLAMPATALLFGVALGAIAGSTPTFRSARASAPWKRLPVLLATTVGFVALAVATVSSGQTLIASFWIARAEAVLRGGDQGPVRALDALVRAERARPGQFRVALLTADAATRAGQGPRALDAAARALAVEPFSPHAWAARASAALAAGAPEMAAAAASRALALLADYPAALDARARAAARLGDTVTWRDARAHLAALAAAGPPIDADAQRILDGLDQRPTGRP
jgi:O-antigen ligase